MHNHFCKKLNLFCLWLTGIFVISVKRIYRWLPAIIIAIIVFVMTIRWWGLLCTFRQPRLYLNDLCAQFENGELTGNLCKSLCIDNEAKDLSCGSFSMNEQAVISTLWRNTSIVMKFPKGDTKQEKWIYWSNGNHPNEKEFNQMIKSNVKSKFNVTITNYEAKSFSYMQHENDVAYPRHTEMKNIWLLMQNNEYLALNIFEKFNIFPKFIGSCGAMYAIESLNPFPLVLPERVVYGNVPKWRNQVTVAIKILEFLYKLEQKLPEPMLLCDVEMYHFGITFGFTEIKYLDLQLVHPLSVINNITGDGKHCTQHSDCDYFDCRSFCNLVTNKCLYGVANNNYQIVCEKIFLGWIMARKVLIPGLLVGPHSPQALLDLLEACANPAQEKGLVRAATSMNIVKRIHAILIGLLK